MTCISRWETTEKGQTTAHLAAVKHATHAQEVQRQPHHSPTDTAALYTEYWNCSIRKATEVSAPDTELFGLLYESNSRAPKLIPYRQGPVDRNRMAAKHFEQSDLKHELGGSAAGFLGIPQLA